MRETSKPRATFAAPPMPMSAAPPPTAAPMTLASHCLRSGSDGSAPAIPATPRTRSDVSVSKNR